MKHPLTEQDIRQLLKKDGSLHSLCISKGTLVTPSALEFLKMHGISLDFSDNAGEESETEECRAEGYIGLQGEKLDSKPEELTHLYGNLLTKKDNPVIAFRGKLDKLCAMILEAQLLGQERENRAFVNDMQEVLEFVRSLLPAEYKCTPLKEFRLLGFSSGELRKRSHNPEKYFGRKHLLMHYSMGALCLRLNLLRTQVREAELAAVTTLRDSLNPGNPSDSGIPLNSGDPPNSTDSIDPTKCWYCREDIVKALNRLSSLFYILIYKYLPKDYSPTGNAGI
ncbi:MAG: hypothetical protein LBH07_02860 [Treponema sp.]|jgi:ethanolamine utilization cobalamin adenosyltransferase|nr:hypothetical protein [Treponema sp.]